MYREIKILDGPIVLFLCDSNVARSQMARVFFRSQAERYRARSAGINPKEYEGHKLEEYPDVVQCMAEKGYDLRKEVVKRYAQEDIENPQLIITMTNNGLPLELRDLKAKGKVKQWKIPDPRGMPLQFYRYVRDLIEKKVNGLVAQLEKHPRV